MHLSDISLKFIPLGFANSNLHNLAQLAFIDITLANAVPAALKYSIPKADPAVYFGMSLGLTFPINIMIGIPLYAYIAKLFY